VGTQDVDENATSTAMPITRSIPTPRMKPFRPPPSARSMENGPRIVPPQLTDEAGYTAQVSALFRHTLFFPTGRGQGVSNRQKSPSMANAHFRMAVRTLRQSPTFTLIAVLSLALGIGVSTSVYALTFTLFFAPPAGVDQPDSLVRICRLRNGQP